MYHIDDPKMIYQYMTKIKPDDQSNQRVNELRKLKRIKFIKDGNYSNFINYYAYSLTDISISDIIIHIGNIFHATTSINRQYTGFTFVLEMKNLPSTTIDFQCNDETESDSNRNLRFQEFLNIAYKNLKRWCRFLGN